jgi:hypothetical protein
VNRQTPFRALAAALLTLFPLTSSPAQDQSPPGEGVLCAWLSWVYAYEVAVRCGADDEPIFRSIRFAISEIEDCVAANSDTTLEMLNEERLRLISVIEFGACLQNPFLELPKILPPREVRTLTGQMTARPGNPTYGSCLY